MFDQSPDLRFKLLVIIPKYSQIAESTYTRVIPLMMQFLVLKCVSTDTRGQLIQEYIRYIKGGGANLSKIKLTNK